LIEFLIESFDASLVGDDHASHLPPRAPDASNYRLILQPVPGSTTHMQQQKPILIAHGSRLENSLTSDLYEVEASVDRDPLRYGKNQLDDTSLLRSVMSSELSPRQKPNQVPPERGD
jgi:hypothetical protein